MESETVLNVDWGDVAVIRKRTCPSNPAGFFVVVVVFCGFLFVSCCFLLGGWVWGVVYFWLLHLFLFFFFLGGEG